MDPRERERHSKSRRPFLPSRPPARRRSREFRFCFRQGRSSGMKTIHFASSASLAPTFTTPRPEGHLTLIGLGSRSDHVFGYVLIDSGADYVVLSEHSGLGAGIALPSKPTTTLSGVGGSVFFFSSRRRHTRCSRDWSSDVCSSD